MIASGKFSVPTSYSTASAASNVRAVCAFFRRVTHTEELTVVNRGDHSDHRVVSRRGSR